MKASWWKYVLLALITAGVVACGSDNKTGDVNQATNGFGTGGVQTPVSTNSYSEFRNQVLAGNFKALPSNVTYSRYEGYNYNLDWDDVVFGIDGCKHRNGGVKERVYDNGTYSHEYGTTWQSIVSGFGSIVNAPQNYSRVSGTYWIVLHGGFEYGFDLNLPIVANPVFKRISPYAANSSTCKGSVYNLGTTPAMQY